MLRPITTRLTASIVLGMALMGTALPASAYAEVRPGDTVLGSPADQQGIDASELPDLIARHALVVGADGTAYYERDADSPIKIASVTKVMTALIALETCQLTDTVTVDHAAATVGESSVGLKEGDTMTLEEALTALMVQSGNDAAMAIATSVGAHIDPSSSDPYGTFIDAMNKRAAEIGCTDTLFENPHGLDFGAWTGELHSTTRDITKIYMEAMKNEQFRSFDNSTRTSMEVTSADGTPRTINLKAYNKIQGQQGNIGGKTGSTYEAGECFVSAFSREVGGEVYIAVFGSEGDDGRFGDTLALANWYYDHLATIPLANTQTKLGDAPVVAQASCTDWTDRTVRVTMEDADATVTVFSLAGALEQQVDLKSFSGSVERGANAGSLSYTQGGTTVGETQLITMESVAGPSPFEWVMIQFDRLVRFFTGEPNTAEQAVFNEIPDPLALDNWNASA